ncbi:MAG: hypothetical protein U1G08_11490 [Verrucomicrobiota bacterium]
MRRHNGREAIEIGFTDQRISPRAGLWPWADFLHGRGFRQVLEQVLPRRSSPNQIARADLALGYLAGIFSGGTKLAHCAQLRIDPLLPEMLSHGWAASSSYSRFFGQFDSLRMNSECFGRLWRWGLGAAAQPPGRLAPSIWTPPTCCMRTPGRRRGALGVHPEGFRRCLHPLLGMISEVLLLAGFRLRPGNTRSDNNAVAFTQELLGRLPSWVRLTGAGRLGLLR